MEKKCSHCGKILPETEFYKDQAKKDGLTCRCKTCKRLTQNADYRRRYEKKYRETHKQQRSEIVKRSMKRNEEHHKEQRRIYLKTQKGMEMYKRQTQNRYALRKASYVTRVDTVKLFYDSPKKCFYCGKELTLKTMTIDHFVPLSKGGKHEIENLRICCRTCNTSKGAKLYEEWRH